MKNFRHHFCTQLVFSPAPAVLHVPIRAVLLMLLMLSLLLSQAAWTADAEGRDGPGRAKPVSSVAPQSFYIAWGDGEEERSYIVIEPGDGLRRPAILATVEAETGKLRVSYAATAYTDADGNIHIDATQSRIYGPDRNRWSPDSFMIMSSGKLRWMDDAMRGGGGRVLGWSAKDAQMPNVPSAFRKAAHQHNYDVMRLMTRMHLEGSL